MKYRGIIVLLLLAGCNGFHRPHWLHWGAIRDTTRQVDPFCTDRGDWDDSRIPLIKPYDAINLNGMKNWLMNRHRYADCIDNIKEVMVVDSLILIHSGRATVYHGFDNVQVNEAWFVIRPKDSLEQGFEKKEEFEQYLNANYHLKSYRLVDVHVVFSTFAAAGTINWVKLGEEKGVEAQIALKAKPEEGEEGSEEELEGFYDDQIASYTQRCEIDSTFTLGAYEYHLHVKDSCLFDSAITVPRMYVAAYKLDSFVTHNFISKIRLERDGKVVLERVVTKRDFEPVLDESLRHYATLLCPAIHLKDHAMLVEYSVSIPLTDVGRREIAQIDIGGHLVFREAGVDD